MLTETKTWDLRVTSKLLEFLSAIRISTESTESTESTKSKPRMKPYYWKLNQTDCEQLIRLLCDAYDVPIIPTYSCKNPTLLKKFKACGLCVSDPVSLRSEIYAFSRPHIKTIIHEVYHHIDFYYKSTRGKKVYDSSDYKQYAWTFAELMWNKMRADATTLSKKLTK